MIPVKDVSKVSVSAEVGLVATEIQREVIVIQRTANVNVQEWSLHAPMVPYVEAAFARVSNYFRQSN